MKIEFKEEQKFTQWWLWLILFGIGILPIFGIYKQLILGEKFGDKPMSDFGLIIFCVLIFGLIAMFWFMRLKTEIDQNEIRMNFFPFVKKYSSKKGDIGNVSNYEDFLEAQAEIFDQVYNVTKEDGYLVIITNNVYFQGELYPLAFDTASSLRNRGKHSWKLKDEKIWLQDDKPLIALGVNNAWVGNRHHQYCLVFRKEKREKSTKK